MQRPVRLEFFWMFGHDLHIISIILELPEQPEKVTSIVGPVAIGLLEQLETLTGGLPGKSK